MKLQSSVLVLLGIIGGLLVSDVNGHGYMNSPRTLNWVAHVEGQSGMAGVPPPENCPHCLNRNYGVCGVSSVNGNNYDNYVDGMGNPIPWHSEDQFYAGQLIEVETYLDTHHNGHMELRLCNMGEASTQACFDMPGSAATFVEDPLYGMPADPNYPERGYYAHGEGGGIKSFKMTFRLPLTVYGGETLMQWKYITANSCSPPGYDSYFGGVNSQDRMLPASYWKPTISVCDMPLPQDGTVGNGKPEQFWNCARVSVDPPPPTISPAPTKAPVTFPPSVSQIPSWILDPYNGCCSQTFKHCDASWCGNDQYSCESCPGNAFIWLPPGGLSDCIQRWSNCMYDYECCPGLACHQTTCTYVEPEDDPPTASPTSSPTETSGSGSCSLDSRFSDYWVITEGNAKINYPSMSANKGVVVGGYLVSPSYITVNQVASFIGYGEAPATWTFNAGFGSINTGKVVSDYVDFEQLKSYAASALPLSTGQYEVIVLDSGGAYMASDLGVNTGSVGTKLVVFQGSSDIILKGLETFSATILAPFAKVILQDPHQITGPIIAMELDDQRIVVGGEYTGPTTCA